jgi:hypothetical protein
MKSKEELKFKNRQIGAAGFVANKIIMKEETNLKKHLDSCKEYQGPRRSAIVDKQETLEEAAAKHFNEEIFVEGVTIQYALQEAFIEGAKWQQERMYSEEDMREAIFTSFLLGVDRGNYSKELEDDLLKKFKKK